MTLIIAYLLMSMIEAHWVWYPVVFVVWLCRVTAKVTFK